MQSLDIPQANALETVRQIVRAIDLGVTRVESLADYTDYSTRHVSYRLHAARILGLVRLHGDEAELTPLGERLLITKLRSEEERADHGEARQRGMHREQYWAAVVPLSSMAGNQSNGFLT